MSRTAVGAEHVRPAGLAPPLQARVGAMFWALALGLLLYYLLLYVVHAADLARYPYDFDQGEGYDVNSGWLLAQGRPIYTDNNVFPYYSSNYPPVYSLLLAPIVALSGPVLGVGRLLSAGAALLTALLIGAVVYRRTTHWPAALTAGLFYVGSNYVYHVTPLARVNALAALFALLGLYCCLRADDGRQDLRSIVLPRPSSRWLVGAVVAFLLALFTKQTTVDAVAAGLLFLLVRERRSGLIVTAAVALIGGLLWLLLDLAHGGQFWINVVVGNVNPFSVGQALAYSRNFLELHAVLVGLAGWQAWRAFRPGRWGPFELYWLAALLLAVTVGKWGAGESYFLAPIVASCVLTGSTLADASRLVRGWTWAPTLVGALVLLQGVLLAHGPLYRLGPFLADRGAQAAVLSREPGGEAADAGAELVELLRKSDGPVLSEDPGFSLVAGKEVVGNATHLRNLYRAGVWRPDNLVGDLASRRFSFAVLDAELYPEPVLEAIGRYYYLYEEYLVDDTRQQLFAPGER